jgi:hypothetical protein
VTAAARSYVFVVDADVTLDPSIDLKVIAAGLAAQLCEDVAPEWDSSTSDTVRAPDDATPPLAGEVQIQIHANAPPDEQGALALHDKQEDGTPIVHVFYDLLVQYGVSLSSGTSHETCEATADPEGDREATLPDGRVVAVEICDQVEASTYKKNGVEVSNFNTKSNFGIGGNAAPYDKLALQTAQFQVLDGGYAQVLTDNGWEQLSSNMSEYRAELDRRGLSRTAKRRRRQNSRKEQAQHV